MKEATMSDEKLVMRWFPVVDERGRTHMEARWQVETAHATPTLTQHAA